MCHETFEILRWCGLATVCSHCCRALASSSRLREDEHRRVIGMYFMELYVRLARNALDSGLRLYRVRPKFHLLFHLLVEPRASMLNPAHCSCWMDEDFVKKSMRIKKAVHRRTATLRCLQRWLLALPQKLGEAAMKLK